jgi:BNR repeat-like domain
VNTVRRRAIPANTVPALSLALLATLFIVGGHRQPPPASAQGGSPPLRGGAERVPDQETGLRLLKAPSGHLFRVWTRWADESGGAVLLASSPDGVSWQSLIQIQSEEAKVRAQQGRVAVNDAGDVALVYRLTHSREIKHIRLARSTDAGKTWTVPTGNLESSGNASDPQVAWGSGGTLIVAWSDRARGRRLPTVYSRRSPDGGVTWESEVVMAQPDRDDATSYAPRLVGDGKGRFWLVWIDLREAGSTLRLARSEDNGRTWSASQSVSGDSRSVFGHSLELSSNNRLLLTWQDQRFEQPDRTTRSARVYATASKDGGATWSAVVEVDGLSAAERTHAAFPSSALTPAGEAWMAWHDNRNGRNDIFVARSADGGLTWGAAQRLDADNAGTAESHFPKLAVSPDGAVVAVVWEDDRSGLEAVYGRILSNGKWSGETRLSPTLGGRKGARVPLIVSTNKDAFYVVWEVWDYSRGPKPLRSGLDGTLFAARP